MICWENGKYKEDILAMWQRNFHDPAPYAEFYFEEVYGKNRVMLNLDKQEEEKDFDKAGRNIEKSCPKGEREAEIKGMLHLNPYTLHIQGKPVKACYIVGVATDEEYRRQGVMRELLTETFSYLRKEGQILTYLMPANDAYYLPFDFRFGALQKEQELEYHPGDKANAAFSCRFRTGEEIDVGSIAAEENRMRDKTYAVHTEISAEYLKRLIKETKSDFGRLLFVYKEEKYMGRFIMNAENDYMVLSRIVCTDVKQRSEFLKEIIAYTEAQYHYGKYQLVMDESWEPLKNPLDTCPGNRLLKAGEKKIIMFRILNLEAVGAFLKTEKEASCCLYVTDDYVREQQGAYAFCCGDGGCRIKKLSGKDTEALRDGGKIALADLTAILFGDMSKEKIMGLEHVTDRGKETLLGIHPLRNVCIQEIV